MNCRFAKLIGKSGAGNNLYYCELKDRKFGSLTAKMCIECDDYERDYSEPSYDFLELSYTGKGVQNCCWRMICSDEFIEKNNVEVIYNWTFRKVHYTNGNISLKKLDHRIFELTIKGRGRDDRCRFCKSFRTALNTSTNGISSVLKDCPFGEIV
ncbi:hypothetical protein [Methanolobus bombayensis]|uniref:hypothetical protein n=1 Tax=Methanolobus bombayensis TaxID=38023 RepID=UPI001AE7ABB1|nr:hypothetical protein [Methanolobus bombayensis]MBP1908309.1 hypothetical protein [Methanolobus bombayensis]